MHLDTDTDKWRFICGRLGRRWKTTRIRTVNFTRGVKHLLSCAIQSGVYIPPNILNCLLQCRSMKCIQFQPQVGLLFLPLLLSFIQKCISQTDVGCVWPMGHCCSSSKSFSREAHWFDWSIDQSATILLTGHVLHLVDNL